MDDQEQALRDRVKELERRNEELEREVAEAEAKLTPRQRAIADARLAVPAVFRLCPLISPPASRSGWQRWRVRRVRSRQNGPMGPI
jgi:cell division septum initiation protein DivIVA